SGAGRREHADDLARPRVGAVELLQRKFYAVVERVGGLEADVDADRLFSRSAVELLDLLARGSELLADTGEVAALYAERAPFHQRRGTPAAFGLRRLGDARLGPFVDDRVRGVERVEGGVEQEALDRADDDDQREH